MRSERWIKPSVPAAIALAVFALSSTSVQAQGQALQPQLDGPALVDALRAGGLVILMRHMSTDDFVPAEGAHDDHDCTSQRNLNDQGRRAAEAIGAAFKRLGIPVGAVMTSPYCRCIDTGMLAFGKATPTPDLAVFDELSGPEKDARGKLIRKLLNTAPAAGSNNVLITHTGTLLYSFGLQTQPEGIAHVFRPAEFGNAIYLGHVTPDEWTAIADSLAKDS